MYTADSVDKRNNKLQTRVQNTVKASQALDYHNLRLIYNFKSAQEKHNDKNYKNLELGNYDIIAMGGSITVGGMTAPWLKIIVYGETWYCLALSDRCRIEDKPAEPAADLSAVLAALKRIESTQKTQGKQLTELLNSSNLLQNKLIAAGTALAGK